MYYYHVLLGLGIWTLLIPLLGFPQSLARVFSFVIGGILVVLSILLYQERLHRRGNAHKKTVDKILDNETHRYHSGTTLKQDAPPHKQSAIHPVEAINPNHKTSVDLMQKPKSPSGKSNAMPAGRSDAFFRT
ncbi:MAG: hypothetical protein ACI83D_000086 [Planctomycetota bacterium]|jgi:hypothetical protein